MIGNGHRNFNFINIHNNQFQIGRFQLQVQVFQTQFLAQITYLKFQCIDFGDEGLFQLLLLLRLRLFHTYSIFAAFTRISNRWDLHHCVVGLFIHCILCKQTSNFCFQSG